jgi:hypothetical protein
MAERILNLDEFLDKAAIDSSLTFMHGLITVEKKLISTYPRGYDVTWAYFNGQNTPKFFHPMPIQYDTGEKDDIETALDVHLASAADKLRKRGMRVPEPASGERALQVRQAQLYSHEVVTILKTLGINTSESDFLSRGQSEGIGKSPACRTGTVYDVATKKKIAPETILAAVKKFYAMNPVS